MRGFQNLHYRLTKSARVISDDDLLIYVGKSNLSSIREESIALSEVAYFDDYRSFDHGMFPNLVDSDAVRLLDAPTRLPLGDM